MVQFFVLRIMDLVQLGNINTKSTIIIIPNNNKGFDILSFLSSSFLSFKIGLNKP